MMTEYTSKLRCAIERVKSRWPLEKGPQNWMSLKFFVSTCPATLHCGLRISKLHDLRTVWILVENSLLLTECASLRKRRCPKCAICMIGSPFVDIPLHWSGGYFTKYVKMSGKKIQWEWRITAYKIKIPHRHGCVKVQATAWGSETTDTAGISDVMGTQNSIKSFPWP